MLDDGENTYTYDSANRLRVVSGESTVVSYVYNGFGDRVQQTVDGNKTTYTLDLASSLTQVLADDENLYLYGVNRIAQQNLIPGTGTPEYFLIDSLGSVRQLTNTDGIVTLAQSYMPYGDVLSSAGSAASSYGFTGEITDASGLVYLRARYYHPAMGRFLTRDPWDGDYYSTPMSYNPWVYGYGNPVNLTDPSGQYPCDLCKLIPYGYSYNMCMSFCCDDDPKPETKINCPGTDWVARHLTVES